MRTSASGKFDIEFRIKRTTDEIYPPAADGERGEFNHEAAVLEFKDFSPKVNFFQKILFVHESNKLLSIKISSQRKKY